MSLWSEQAQFHTIQPFERFNICWAPLSLQKPNSFQNTPCVEGDSYELISENQELCVRGKESCCTALWFLFPCECVVLYSLPDLNYKFLQCGRILLAYKVISTCIKKQDNALESSLSCILCGWQKQLWDDRKRAYALICLENWWNRLWGVRYHTWVKISGSQLLDSAVQHYFLDPMNCRNGLGKLNWERRGKIMDSGFDIWRVKLTLQN